MAKEIFLIGIGGTGMRCLESFVHLCAMGMFDDHTVNMLALDTDRLNGNFTRLKELIEPYQALNGGAFKSNTLFSARIDYRQFSPAYDGNNVTFNSISDYSSASTTQHGEEVKYKESDIADLFLDPDVRDMQLEHGYRAQTQMGSMLMYHAILEEAYKTKRSEYKSELRPFIQKLNESKGNQVFIFGSVFGGTGASSIPIIPRAFQKAAEIMFGDQAEVLNRNFYGSVVLTNYFSFGIQNQDKIVATSDKFALNSQAALMFYCSDKSIENTYKRLYLLGREKMKPLPNESKTDTGGKNQRNPVDYIELMSAFAAYDFFKVCDKGEQAFLRSDGKNSLFYFISHDASIDKLDFICFTEAHEEFKKKFGVLLAVNLLDASTSFFAQKRNEEFKFSEEQLSPLYNYMKLFYDVANTRDGWAYQMYASAEDYPKKMLFHSAPFDKNVDLKKLKFNETLFDEDTPPAFKQKGGILGMGGSIFNTVKDAFKDVSPEKKSTMDDMISRLYATLLSLYFNEKPN